MFVLVFHIYYAAFRVSTLGTRFRVPTLNVDVDVDGVYERRPKPLCPHLEITSLHYVTKIPHTILTSNVHQMALFVVVVVV